MTHGLYIHVPFCIRKCPYCDFYSVEDLSAIEVYLKALVSEMQMRAEGFAGAVFDTVYFGGGTPSVLGALRISKILEAASRHFSIQTDAEITLEANPGTLSCSSMAQYRSAGVNRINIGVQSFNDFSLSFLGRIHSARNAVEALDGAQKAGFSNIGMDLIYGLPGQSNGAWQKDLAAAAAFAPSHISCYMLTYEPATQITKDMDAGRFEALPEKRVADMFVKASKFLSARGFCHYEISNFAASENECSRHNRKYWQNHPYLGLGPSAHSYAEPERFWNCKDLKHYTASLSAECLPTARTESLSAPQMMMESIYLGLRQADGIDTVKFEKRFAVDFNQIFGPVVKRFVKSGHGLADESAFRLTCRGMLFADSIALEMTRMI